MWVEIGLIYDIFGSSSDGNWTLCIYVRNWYFSPVSARWTELLLCARICNQAKIVEFLLKMKSPTEFALDMNISLVRV